jgi:hypothetical protein
MFSADRMTSDSPNTTPIPRIEQIAVTPLDNTLFSIVAPLVGVQPPNFL